MSAETEIPPPVNPVVLAANLWILRRASEYFMGKYLPGYVQLVTSDARTPEHNKAIGGAANSAHVHNLAEDFILKFRGTGKALTEAEARKVYNDTIVPNWPGWTEFESASSAEGYHIHWNLSREITTFVSLAAVAGIGGLIYLITKKLRGVK